MMTQVSLGDMTQTWLLRRQNAALKQQLTDLGQEVTTGRTANITRHLSGDFGILNSIEHDLKTLASYHTTLTEAAGFAGAAQSSLEHIQRLAGDLSTNLLKTDGAFAELGDTLTGEAEQAFTTMVSTLNGTYAGQSLFTGQALDQRALPTGATILSSIRTAIGADLSVTNIRTTIDAWFAPGGGFDTASYQGSLVDRTAFRLNDTDTVAVSVRADNDAIKDLLRLVATAAIAGDATTTSDRSSLLQSAGEGLLTSDDAIIKLRASLGFKEQSIQHAQTQHAAEQNSLELAYNDLLGVNPYSAATELQNVETRLQTIYAITARMSSMSLVSFLS